MPNLYLSLKPKPLSRLEKSLANTPFHMHVPLYCLQLWLPLLAPLTKLLLPGMRLTDSLLLSSTGFWMVVGNPEFGLFHFHDSLGNTEVPQALSAVLSNGSGFSNVQFANVLGHPMPWKTSTSLKDSSEQPHPQGDLPPM